MFLALNFTELRFELASDRWHSAGESCEKLFGTTQGETLRPTREIRDEVGVPVFLSLCCVFTTCCCCIVRGGIGILLHLHDPSLMRVAARRLNRSRTCRTRSRRWTCRSRSWKSAGGRRELGSRRHHRVASRSCRLAPVALCKGPPDSCIEVHVVR